MLPADSSWNVNETVGAGMIALYHKWNDTCSRRPTTVDSRNVMNQVWPNKWSIDSDLERHEHYKNCHSCRDFNVTEVLHSVRMGSGCCAIDWPSTASVCRTLQRYSAVYWIGDSLTRHMVYALYQLLLGDLHWAKVKSIDRGSAPSGTILKRTSSDENLRRQCQCDGMYIDNIDSLACRERDYSTMFNLTRPSLATLCLAHLMDPRPFLFFYRHHSNQEDLPNAFKCINDSRPQFLYLSSINPQYTLEKVQKEVIGKVLTFVSRAQQSCPFRMKLHVIWGGASPFSREHDKKWPLQSREHALDLNAKVDAWLATAHPDIKILDFFQMTIDDLTHDGVHFQTSTNVKKATVLLSLMDRWRDSAGSSLHT
jgi:hypothetical protein